MSAGEMQKTACVIGGSGYIASALVKTLLKKGYAVKTTVRDPGKLAKPLRLVGEVVKRQAPMISSQKLVGEGFVFKYESLGEIFYDLVEYGRATGILLH